MEPTSPLITYLVCGICQENNQLIMVTVRIQKVALLIHKDILVCTIIKVQISVETLILTFSLLMIDAALAVVELTHHLNLLLREFGTILMVQLVPGL